MYNCGRNNRERKHLMCKIPEIIFVAFFFFLKDRKIKYIIKLQFTEIISRPKTPRKP